MLRRKFNCQGQALVEFAATIFFFIMLLVFFFYTVLTLYDYFTLQEIAREAARQRVVYTLSQLPDAKLRMHLRNYGSLSSNYSFSLTEVSPNPGAVNDLTILVSQPDGDNSEELYVEVIARARRTGGNVLGFINFPPEQLSYTLRMRQEWEEENP